MKRIVDRIRNVFRRDAPPSVSTGGRDTTRSEKLKTKETNRNLDLWVEMSDKLQPLKEFLLTRIKSIDNKALMALPPELRIQTIVHSFNEQIRIHIKRQATAEKIIAIIEDYRTRLVTAESGFSKVNGMFDSELTNAKYFQQAAIEDIEQCTGLVQKIDGDHTGFLVDLLERLRTRSEQKGISFDKLVSDFAQDNKGRYGEDRIELAKMIVLQRSKTKGIKS